ncbi:MAG TPA: DUF2652 domain-containing protein [Chloroflexota bacterium]|nr:DUF2652 domain-containing protein [Chloroflexota bacterium]
MDDGMQQGYLIIADISGYTAYLTGTELAHAQNILSRLIQTILDAYRPPIELVELEGDAVYVYLPGADAGDQAVLGAIERAYFAFARQRDSMGHLAACVCAACRNLPMLDLKFVVHFGEFAVQRLAGRSKPIGPDVILVHRLLKNHVADVMGLRAYVFFTDAALARLGLDAAALDLRHHREEYEHLGEVGGAVLDLAARWEQERALRRLRLDPAAARSEHAVDVPAPPEVVWAYLTRPAFRARWEPGLAGAAAGDTAEHAPDEHTHGAGGSTLLDWQPFEYYTLSRALDAPLAPRVTLTTELTPTPGGTRVAWYCAPAAGLRAALGFTLGRGKLQASQRAGGERLASVLAAEWPPPAAESAPEGAATPQLEDR